MMASQPSFSIHGIMLIFVNSTDNMFHFTCFNVEDPHDPSVGLNHGELSIPGNLLRREVFDPVVNEVRFAFGWRRSPVADPFL
jgi:hypothetical protein